MAHALARSRAQQDQLRFSDVEPSCMLDKGTALVSRHTTSAQGACLYTIAFFDGQQPITLIVCIGNRKRNALWATGHKSRLLPTCWTASNRLMASKRSCSWIGSTARQEFMPASRMRLHAQLPEVSAGVRKSQEVPSEQTTSRPSCSLCLVHCRCKAHAGSHQEHTVCVQY